jgi:acyl-CoA thioesterase-1
MSDLRAVFLGDSYMAGVGDDSALGWIGRVAAAARGEGADLTVYNLGVRRETGPEIAARTTAELAPRLRHGDAYAVVAAFGGNDIALGVPLEASLEAAGRIIDLAREWKAEPFLMSPPRFPAHVGDDAAAAAMTAGLAAVCLRKGAAFLDLRTSGCDWDLFWREADAGDGVHPNAGGYASVAAVVASWTPWRAWLGLAEV